MIVKYISGNSEKEFILNQNYELRIKECNPYSTSWKYTSEEAQYGINIQDFSKDPIELQIVFKFRGSLNDINSNLKDFFEETEKDIIGKQSGKLYIGSYYLAGYFLQKETQPSSEYFGREMTTTFLAPYPFWINEKLYSFYPQDQEPQEAGNPLF